MLRIFLSHCFEYRVKNAKRISLSARCNRVTDAAGRDMRSAVLLHSTSASFRLRSARGRPIKFDLTNQTGDQIRLRLKFVSFRAAKVSLLGTAHVAEDRCGAHRSVSHHRCTWEDGEVGATLRQPLTCWQRPKRVAVGGTVTTAKTQIWLGD
jgi:hypothetical protein